MFRDISFIGAAACQKEGYAHISSSHKELRRRSMYIENMTRGLIAAHKHGHKSHQDHKRHSIDQSLVVIDTDPLNHCLSTANSVNSIINHVQEEKEEVGRVAGWAVNFDKLLRDNSGVCVFTEFLKKEFSEENIVFWMTVEKYKQITNQDMRKVQAKDIFNKHLSVCASEPVNIDSIARQQADSQMDIPTPQIFDVAQHQIYQLMKQDSYARFLKSELYKTCLLKEMEGKPLDIPVEENENGKETDDKEKDSKKKTKGKQNEDKEKRRRSLLPWRQKASKNSMKLSSDAEAKKSKGKEKDKEREVNNNTKKSTSTTTALPTDVTPNSIPSVGISLSTTRKEVQANWTESGYTAVLDLEGLVSSLDNQRVFVSKDDSPGYQRRRSSLFGFIGKRVHRNGSKGSCIDKDETKGHIALQKNEVRKHPNDGDDLCHLLKIASSRSLDDQRGVSMQDLELPEFLRKSERPLSG